MPQEPLGQISFGTNLLQSIEWDWTLGFLRLARKRDPQPPKVFLQPCNIPAGIYDSIDPAVPCRRSVFYLVVNQHYPFGLGFQLLDQYAHELLLHLAEAESQARRDSA